VLLQSDTTLTVRGEKWKELSELLPHLGVSATQSATQIDFAALGFRFKIPGVPSVVGPIGIFQGGAYLSQTVFDYHAIERTRGAMENEKAADYSLKNARELVVLAVGNSPERHLRTAHTACLRAPSVPLLANGIFLSVLRSNEPLAMNCGIFMMLVLVIRFQEGRAILWPCPTLSRSCSSRSASSLT
ncbi:MAG: hypothetical protein ACLQIJ_19700, partial [Polyangia bacterium]